MISEEWRSLCQLISPARNAQLEVKKNLVRRVGRPSFTGFEARA
jgi:hypothetical protein